MKLTIDTKTLVHAVGLAAETAPRKSSHSIITHLRLEATQPDNQLIVQATDLETRFSGRYPAVVEQAGVICLPAAKLEAMAKAATSDQVEIAVRDEEKTKINAGRVRYNLMGLDGNIWPDPPEDAAPTDLRIPADVLAEVLGICAPHMSRDANRFNLAALFVKPHGDDGLLFAATDGHRLAVLEREGLGAQGLDLDDGLLIPRDAVARLQKMCAACGDEVVTLGLATDNARLTVGDESLAVRGQEGTFPDYTFVIPKRPPHTMTVVRPELAAAIKRVRVTTQDKFNGIKFTATTGALELEATSEIGRANERVETDYSGAEVSLALNARYLADVCAVLKSHELHLHLTDDQSPIKITAEGDPGYTGVIMPMKL